ncbi:MAG: hypothetical protein AAGE52_38455 [Myxococcota bacterium]
MSEETQETAEEAKAKAEAKAKLAAHRAKLEERHKESPQGEIVVTLERRIQVGEQTRATLVVRLVKFGDLRAIGDAPGALNALMDRLVSPPGAADELLTRADVEAVQHAVDRQLGKYQGRRYGSEPSEP